MEGYWEHRIVQIVRSNTSGYARYWTFPRFARLIHDAFVRLATRCAMAAFITTGHDVIYWFVFSNRDVDSLSYPPLLRPVHRHIRNIYMWCIYIISDTHAKVNCRPYVSDPPVESWENLMRTHAPKSQGVHLRLYWRTRYCITENKSCTIVLDRCQSSSSNCNCW